MEIPVAKKRKALKSKPKRKDVEAFARKILASSKQPVVRWISCGAPPLNTAR
jgi:hypothetical protein